MTVDPTREYRETAVRSASPVGLVIMLYEAAIQDLRDIAAAMEANDIQRRSDQSHHLLQVLNQLQGSLDMERGGEVAANLDQYYNLVRSRLLEAELKNSKEIIEWLLKQFLSLHQAWVEVDQNTAPGREHAAPGRSPSSQPASSGIQDRSSASFPAEPLNSTTDWSA
jgi:flagellar secretion chaperone FliS